MGNIIRQAADLLQFSPSTDKQDLPTGIPNWYLRDVDKYHERGRKAAIALRDAHDKIEKLEGMLSSKTNWSDAPEWANYKAVDSAGNEWWYETKPIVYNDLGVWVMVTGRAVQSTTVIEWKDTLEKRDD